METEVFMKSLILFFFSFVKIDNLPSLVGSIMSVPNDNISSFFIFSSMDIKAFVGLLEVAEVLALVLEDLPPSRVGAPDLHVAGSS
jgi:hypothetical protein